MNERIIAGAIIAAAFVMGAFFTFAPMVSDMMAFVDAFGMGLTIGFLTWVTGTILRILR
jgi:Na+-transporting NADH:ubiquinone oxidoreductase subunit NqrD